MKENLLRHPTKLSNIIDTTRQEIAFSQVLLQRREIVLKLLSILLSFLSVPNDGV